VGVGGLEKPPEAPGRARLSAAAKAERFNRAGISPCGRPAPARSPWRKENPVLDIGSHPCPARRPRLVAGQQSPAVWQPGSSGLAFLRGELTRPPRNAADPRMEANRDEHENRQEGRRSGSDWLGR